MNDGMTCPRCSGALREGDSEWLCECGVCGRQWPPPANLVARVASLEEENRAMREALTDLVRFQPEEGRANRSHYAEHGMLCLCAYDGTGHCDCGWMEWQTAHAAASAALRVKGDGT
jgi:hypothetical protein